MPKTHKLEDVTVTQRCSLACRLGANSLRDEGIIAICNALSENKASKLQELNLTSNGITETGAKSVAAYLAVTGGLTKIE